MKTAIWFVAFAACLAMPAAAHAEVNPTDRLETYAISGTTGLELYTSIGENSPQVGGGRAIAYTTFDLKWSRNYVPQKNGGCTLATAKPHLIIITKLPKPKGALPAETQARWDTFITGLKAHEKVHADIIIDMVEKIEAYSVGLTEPNDPGCKKVRATLQKRLGELSQAQRQLSRDFDRMELSSGGNVHSLVLGLVGGLSNRIPTIKSFFEIDRRRCCRGVFEQ